MARKKQKRKRNKNRNKKRNFLPFALITLGIILFSIGTFASSRIYSNYLISRREQPKKNYSVQAPVGMLIPSVKIETKVVEGGIVDGNWILSYANALYLPTSGKMGEGYNTIIYAHDTDKLFGKLKNIKPDDVVILSDKQGREYVYRVFSREDVDPTDLRKLYSEEKNIVTLFTCDGWFDSKRLLIRAKLIGS